MCGCCLTGTRVEQDEASKSRMRLLTPGAISEQQGLLDDVSLPVQTMEEFAALEERLAAHNELMRALVINLI